LTGYVPPEWCSFAQAVSYSRAIRSGAWFGGVKGKKAVVYDRDHIAQCERSIRGQEDFWKRAFELTKAEVLEITYEQLLAEPRSTLEKILGHVGVRQSEGQAVNVSELPIQRGSSSRRWVERYRHEQGTGNQLGQIESIARVSDFCGAAVSASASR
jgi:LPS sulfotransferase NodH